jgi:hypothetical protein
MSTEETAAPAPAPEPAEETPITMDSISQVEGGPGSTVEPPPPPPPITIDELLNSTAVILQKEADDKLALEAIGNISHDELKTKLLSWATSGFPNVYEIHRVTIVPPVACSDGVSRELSEYIVFCSGKTISEHVALLQAKVQGMSISFANMGTYISIVVSKV